MAQGTSFQGRSTRWGRLRAAVRSVLDPRPYFHAFRLLHYYNYVHVTPRRALTTGPGVRIAPNASFSHAERISIGARSRIGARCSLWAGPLRSRIEIGADCTLAPDVFLTAANYRREPDRRILDQGSDEADIVIGDDVWLGARVIVLAGVRIGDGCVVGAGSVVTRSLPAHSVAVGAPARTVASRAASG